MNYIFLLALSFFVFVIPANAQLVDNAEGISLLEAPGFNPSFVRANKISSIHGVRSTKRSSEVIRKTGEQVTYHFDRTGRLVQIEEEKKLGGQDRYFTSTIFRYSREGQLIDRIIADVNGATSYSYTYNEQNEVISETCSRMESPKDTLSPAGPKRTEIYTENFEYTPLENGLKTITLNNYGRPYKEEIHTYDEHGYLIEHWQRFLMNNKMSRTHYAYDQRGLLSDKWEVANLAAPDSVHFRYEYDESGNLHTARKYQHDKLVRRMEFLYDKVSWLLKARIAKDEENELIRIVEFETRFFE